MLTTVIGEEDIKIFSGMDDDNKVTEGRCRGFLNNGAYLVAGCGMGVCTQK